MPDPGAVTSDAELIAAWKSGKEAAATELMRRHARAVAAYLSAAGGGDDVDDLVQETFFRAFTRLDGFREQSSFRTWVMAIGSNALKDLRRRNARRPVVALDDREVVDEGGDPFGETAAREMEERLERAVAGLPPMQRDVFLMRAQQGMEYDDIANALESSPGAARVHYHHAVKRLRRELE